jgi:hypothetical protein
MRLAEPPPRRNPTYSTPLFTSFPSLTSFRLHLNHPYQVTNMTLILFALYFFPAIAAPVANLTALQTVIAPAWVADPAGRGTWSLLYSCLFTLLLCVYTAIHLNVPPPNDTKLTFWLRKTKWVAIAIFGPELVVYTAFEQWFLAKKFMKAINEAAAKSKVEKNKVRGFIFNRIIGFLIDYPQDFTTRGQRSPLKTSIRHGLRSLCSDGWLCCGRGKSPQQVAEGHIHNSRDIVSCQTWVLLRSESELYPRQE